MDVLHEIALWYRNDATALRSVEIVYYILRKDGAYGSVSLWQGDKTGHPANSPFTTAYAEPRIAAFCWKAVLPTVALGV
jgi:hypothetical protein